MRRVASGIVIWCALGGASADAQDSRNGVHVEIARIAGQSGLDATGFFNVPPSRIQLEAASCEGRRIRAVARAPRGPFRALELVLAAPAGAHEVAFDTGECRSATLDLTLADGTSLHAEQGVVTLSENDDTHVVGTFTGSASTDGQPTTIHGSIRLELPRQP
jgi:hypothetical protein